MPVAGGEAKGQIVPMGPTEGCPIAPAAAAANRKTPPRRSMARRGCHGGKLTHGLGYFFGAEGEPTKSELACTYPGVSDVHETVTAGAAAVPAVAGVVWTS